jgi:catechol 2,3-dioxygenase-like lactoylglutathione lyase family enzyme
VTIFVSDQDKALEFYTKKLGFSVHTDAMFDDDLRWLTINPPGQEDLELSLMLTTSPEEQALVGKQGGNKPLLAFSCDDCEKLHQELKKAEVFIVSAPESQPWGKSMCIADLYGNMLYVVQS